MEIVNQKKESLGKLALLLLLRNELARYNRNACGAFEKYALEIIMSTESLR